MMDIIRSFDRFWIRMHLLFDGKRLYQGASHAIRRSCMIYEGRSREAERRYRKYQVRDGLKAFDRMRKDYLARRFDAEKSFFTERFEVINRDQKAIFKAATNIMHKNNSNPLPEHSSTKQLADDFGYFFNRKVDKSENSFRMTIVQLLIRYSLSGSSARKLYFNLS